MGQRLANYAYVEGAIAAIEAARTYDDLVTWWNDERQNRAKYRLSPRQPPGSTLLQAFDTKRAQLKETINADF